MIALRPASKVDYRFLWELHRTAMKPYVAATWGWDEAWQPDRVWLARIAIVPVSQRRGIGTTILRSVLAQAASQGLPVMLQVLKVNPAWQLYERLGFVITGETETHYLMSTGTGPLSQSLLAVQG